MFGYLARHLISTTLETRDSELLSESQMDGWYIDPPAAWLNPHSPLPPGKFTYISVFTSEKDDYKFTETGKRETGFALLYTRTQTQVCRDATGNSRDYRSVLHQEVTEFSETPLEPDLFVPPLDFDACRSFPIRYTTRSPTVLGFNGRC